MKMEEHNGNSLLFMSKHQKFFRFFLFVFSFISNLVNVIFSDLSSGSFSVTMISRLKVGAAIEPVLLIFGWDTTCRAQAEMLEIRLKADRGRHHLRLSLKEELSYLAEKSAKEEKKVIL